jgi:hypothetical protein
MSAKAPAGDPVGAFTMVASAISTVKVKGSESDTEVLSKIQKMTFAC